MTDKVREEFETAFVERQVDLFGEGYRDSAIHLLKRKGDFDKPPTHYELQRRVQGLYDLDWVEMTYWAWQASRAAVVVDLPQIVGYEAGFDSIRDNEYASQPSEFFDADEVFALSRRIEVIEAIEAAGLKVKP